MNNHVGIPPDEINFSLILHTVKTAQMLPTDGEREVESGSHTGELLSDS